MKLGDRTLKRGMQGKDVVELQLRLSGFRGTIWDGDFGPGTELQVVSFQRDYMDSANPSGVVDAKVIGALERFADEHKIAFDVLKCVCGQCGGFGKGRFRESMAPANRMWKRFIATNIRVFTRRYFMPIVPHGFMPPKREIRCLF